MYQSEAVPQSIVFLTDEAGESKRFIDEMAQEDFLVRVFAKKWNTYENALFQGADLIIVDSSRISLEEVSTFSRIRSVHRGLLGVFTSDVDEMFQVMLYEQGVDALMIKPMKPLLLVAKVRALLRRSCRSAHLDRLTLGDLQINGSSRKAVFGGEEIPLSSREFDLLWYLAKNASVTLDRDRLYRNVFGVEYNGYDRSVDMYISRIRQKLAETTSLPSPIKTVRGKGYLFAVD